MINKDEVSKKERKRGSKKETLCIIPEIQELGIYNTIWEAKNYKE
jgi:hypothetical protein